MRPKPRTSLCSRLSIDGLCAEWLVVAGIRFDFRSFIGFNWEICFSPHGDVFGNSDVNSGLADEICTAGTGVSWCVGSNSYCGHQFPRRRWATLLDPRVLDVFVCAVFCAVQCAGSPQSRAHAV